MLPGDRSGDWSWCIIWWPPLHWFLHPRFLPIPHDLSNAWLSPAQEICEKHHPRHDFAAEGYQHIDVPKEGKITVCGDIHGQFYDLLKIFYLNNLPSEQNPYVFNGDFVDRGHFSTEVVLTLFAWKLALPNHIHLNRGTTRRHRSMDFTDSNKKWSTSMERTCMISFVKPFAYYPFATWSTGPFSWYMEACSRRMMSLWRTSANLTDIASRKEFRGLKLWSATCCGVILSTAKAAHLQKEVDVVLA